MALACAKATPGSTVSGAAAIQLQVLRSCAEGFAQISLQSRLFAFRADNSVRREAALIFRAEIRIGLDFENVDFENDVQSHHAAHRGERDADGDAEQND